jgi:single-strand DNA-binding protein
MSDLNMAAIVGKVIGEPKMKSTGNGLQILNFSISNQRSSKKSGEWQNEYSYIDCVVFGDYAANIAKYLKAGAMVAVCGGLRQDRWEDNGQKRSKINLVCNTVQILSKPEQQNQLRERAPEQQGSRFEQQEEEAPFRDDIPF